MMLTLDTAYRSFGGEVEASSTPTICRLPDSRRHQLSAIAPSFSASRRRGTHLGVHSFSLSPSAAAEPKDEVAAATAAWAQALGEDDPDKVLPLYASDAVLWGTLSPKLRSDPAALRDYFVGAFKALPSLKVTFGDQLI